MSKGYKGGDFEREICKKLSKWWTNNERDDVFWRTSQSGGRATQRKKSGKDTYGSWGDIAAVDPIGNPLLKFFSIELKRGSSHGTPGDLFDALPTPTQRPFEAALLQAQRCATHSGSIGWMLLCRRDRRIAICYIEWDAAKRLNNFAMFFGRPNWMKYDIRVNDGTSGPRRMKFIAIPLDSFLKRVSPQQIIEAVKSI